MKTMTQDRRECEWIDRRAKVRAGNATRCPNCYSSHVEQGDLVEGGRALFPWHDDSHAYAIYVYLCQSCGAEFLAGAAERYSRRHQEAENPTLH